MCYYTSEVACPYFEPRRPDPRFTSPPGAIAPLGERWAGLCRAAPDAPWEPDDATLHPLCNFGYARGACPRFPAGAGPDAVRFTVSRDAGASLHLHYVLERDHHPFAHGPFDYSLPADAFVDSPLPAPLGRLARAYIQSYLRRTRGGWGHDMASGRTE